MSVALPKDTAVFQIQWVCRSRSLLLWSAVCCLCLLNAEWQFLSTTYLHCMSGPGCPVSGPLQDKFTLDRVNKSAAVFDKTKLSWMNGQHLRELPDDKVEPLVAQCWQQSGLLHHLASPFVKFAVAVLKPSLELVVDAERDLRHILAYPLMDTLQGAKVSLDLSLKKSCQG